MSLVLLHGFTGGPSSWDAVAARLGQPAACLTLLGHDGRPPVDDRPRAFHDEVDRLAALVSAPAHLVGYSMGARVGLALLLRHPSLFERATFVGLQGGLRTEAERSERARQDGEWVELLLGRGIEAFVSRWERQPLFASQERLDPEARRAHREARLRHSAAGLALGLRTLGLARMPPCDAAALARVGIPVRLLAGELDSKFVAAARELAAALPRADVRVIPGAGHDLTLEQPAAVAAAILEEAP